VIRVPATPRPARPRFQRWAGAGRRPGRMGPARSFGAV